jgi:hypothetical protein
MDRPKNTIDLIREAQAAQSARLRYAIAHDKFSDDEQTLVLEGRITEAAGAHQFAQICLKVYRAELDDPEPKHG